MTEKVLGFDALEASERRYLLDELLRVDENDLEDMAPPAVPETRVLARYPPPKELLVPMLPFQAEGLGWMVEREADPSTNGGVLADEMGMGKTLQMISTIVENLQKA